MLSTALYERFFSRGEADYQNKLLSAMRFQFGGHLEKPAGKQTAEQIELPTLARPPSSPATGRVAPLASRMKTDAVYLIQTEDTGIGASFSKIALAEVVHVKGRQSALWAVM